MFRHVSLLMALFALVVGSFGAMSITYAQTEDEVDLDQYPDTYVAPEVDTQEDYGCDAWLSQADAQQFYNLGPTVNAEMADANGVACPELPAPFAQEYLNVYSAQLTSQQLPETGVDGYILALLVGAIILIVIGKFLVMYRRWPSL